jgi:hypothetical protein
MNGVPVSTVPTRPPTHLYILHSAHFPTLQPYLLDGATVPWFRFLFYVDDMRTPFLDTNPLGQREKRVVYPAADIYSRCFTSAVQELEN